MMTKYRESLRLYSLNVSERNIVNSVPCSRNTVSKVLKGVNELSLSWPFSEDLTDAARKGMLFPKAVSLTGPFKRKREVVQGSSKSVKQQAYKNYMGLLKLSERYSEKHLEVACERTLGYTASPSYRGIKNIFSTGVDKSEIVENKSESTANQYDITRGADYYQRSTIMINQSTVDKRMGMCLSTEAGAFRSQLNDPKMKPIANKSGVSMYMNKAGGGCPSPYLV